jgi:fructokinase
VERALQLARRHGKLVSVDPNYSSRIWPDQREAVTTLRRALAYATLTKPSLDDAARLFGPGSAPEEYIDMFHRMGPRIVVLTMGTKGVLVSEVGAITHVPARPIEIADATGAGDAFWAGFLVALLDGNPLRRCALFAREVAERKLTTVGPFAGAIDRQALYAAIDALPNREDEA